ncbi:aspartate--tRNA ligase [Firmicutes bacterium CAG:449]|nr:aspartate--tRNA ligase [Firmicutes bacterium CAG:449]
MLKMKSRTHTCGELNINNVNQEVTLVGWVSKKRNLGSLVFIDLRDHFGFVQIVAEDEKFSCLKSIKNEFVIQVKGLVQKRNTPNPKLKTGEIEVVAKEINIINSANLTPFIIADETDALEDTRLKYRYLDLRRPIMQSYLTTRAKIMRSIREYLDSLDFTEIETPILTLSTPEGARDYLVPSRTRKGSFYALPQSPQLFKQLLMIGGMERYYQIARCFRDEDLRADRQPDFTQIDMEMSFMDQDEILTLLENGIKKIFKDVRGIDIETPFRRIPWFEAMSRWGSDKPDTRFGIELNEIKDDLKGIEFEAFTKAENIKAIVVNDVANQTTRKVMDSLNEIAKKYGLKQVTVLKYLNNILEGSFTKYFTDEMKQNLINHLALKENDIVIIGAGEFEKVCFALGALRSHYAKQLHLIKENTFDYLWVVDFPLFEKLEDGSYTSEHHPFTRPREEDAYLLDTAPEKVLSAAYDIVINGYEAGGGSLRIYDQNMQKKIFNILGFTDEDIKRKFGFFVDAFQYGTPPHGGAAFGLDRLTMILSGTDNIRDVIAFPKNLNAVCPMSNAPYTVDEQQLKDLGIEVIKEEK